MLIQRARRFSDSHNKDAFIEDLSRSTRKIPDVRIKEQASFEGKIERYHIAGKDPSTISDTLAGRIMVEQSDIQRQLSNIQQNFNVLEINDFFKSPTEWGYKGINIKVRLPNEPSHSITAPLPPEIFEHKIHALFVVVKICSTRKLTGRISRPYVTVSFLSKIWIKLPSPIIDILRG